MYNMSVLKPCSERPTQLNRERFSRDSVFVWPHDDNTNTNIIYLSIDVCMTRTTMYLENGVDGRRDSSGLPWIWISMDISMCGYQT